MDNDTHFYASTIFAHSSNSDLFTCLDDLRKQTRKVAHGLKKGAPVAYFICRVPAPANTAYSINSDHVPDMAGLDMILEVVQQRGYFKF